MFVWYPCPSSENGAERRSRSPGPPGQGLVPRCPLLSQVPPGQDKRPSAPDVRKQSDRPENPRKLLAVKPGAARVLWEPRDACFKDEWSRGPSPSFLTTQGSPGRPERQGHESETAERARGWAVLCQMHSLLRNGGKQCVDQFNLDSVVIFKSGLKEKKCIYV